MTRQLEPVVSPDTTATSDAGLSAEVGSAVVTHGQDEESDDLIESNVRATAVNSNGHHDDRHGRNERRNRSRG
jgi:hypothetical protein